MLKRVADNSCPNIVTTLAPPSLTRRSYSHNVLKSAELYRNRCQSHQQTLSLHGDRDNNDELDSPSQPLATGHRRWAVEDASWLDGDDEEAPNGEREEDAEEPVNDGESEVGESGGDDNDMDDEEGETSAVEELEDVKMGVLDAPIDETAEDTTTTPRSTTAAAVTATSTPIAVLSLPPNPPPNVIQALLTPAVVAQVQPLIQLASTSRTNSGRPSRVLKRKTVADMLGECVCGVKVAEEERESAAKCTRAEGKFHMACTGMDFIPPRWACDGCGTRGGKRRR
ncbi:hypothetical protein CPB85DRAFT_1362878 [Mucidula mucida]|nr:hypothetical protein CPB85DRAFT_1362878 [Mucidula mucida]